MEKDKNSKLNDKKLRKRRFLGSHCGLYKNNFKESPIEIINYAIIQLNIYVCYSF